MSKERALLAAAAALTTGLPANASDANLSPMQDCLESLAGASVDTDIGPIRCVTDEHYIYFEHKQLGWRIRTDGKKAEFLRQAITQMDVNAMITVFDNRALLEAARYAAGQHMHKRGNAIQS